MSTLFHRALSAIALLALALASVISGRPALAAAAPRCFAETSQCISGRFRDYWEQNGGLAVFGFPITAARDERNRDTGQTYQTQWFERNRFELHPENPAPYDVLLGRLGDDRLLQMGVDWRTLPGPSGPNPPGCLWFNETARTVCDQAPGAGFKTYWQTHGVELDGRPGRGYQESLALFGLPLTMPRVETNSSGDTVLTQWFERARFEWHPNKPAEFRVLLGLLGNEVRRGMPGELRPGRIVYVQAHDIFSGGDLYIMNADGSAQTRITSTNAISLEGAEYAVSPAGDRVAYRVGANLYVVRLDGTGQQLITTDTTYHAPMPPEVFSLAWAPDGSYLAYVSNGDIYATRADGTPAARITRDAGVSVPACLSWARSGYLAFRTPAMHTFKLMVVRSDGSDLRQIAWGLCGELSPAGDRLAYKNGGDFWLVNADGSNPHALTTDTSFLRPFWSPDGTRIATVRYNTDNAYDRDIFVVDATNGHIQQLTTDPDLDDMPSWSPDGKFLAFASKRTRRYGVYTMRADGSGQALLQTPEEAASPQWVR